MDDPTMTAIITGILAIIGTFVGAIIGFLGSLAAARYQAKKARELTGYVDALARKREFDHEERQHKWTLQKIAAEKALKPLLRPTFDRESAKCLHPFDYELTGKAPERKSPYMVRSD